MTSWCSILICTVAAAASGSQNAVLRVQATEIRRSGQVDKISGSRRLNVRILRQQSGAGTDTCQTHLRTDR